MPIQMLLVVLGLLLHQFGISSADPLSLTSTHGVEDSSLVDLESRGIHAALGTVRIDRRIRVRVTGWGLRLEGGFAGSDARFLTVSGLGAWEDTTTRIALVEIDSLWCRHDGGDLGGDIGAGILGTAGAAAGVVAGGFSGGSATALGYSFLGAVAGFAVGRVVGVLIGSYYGEWRLEYP